MDFSKIRNYIFLVGIAVVTILFFNIIRPFIFPIFWAAVIATLFYPVYSKLVYLLNHKHNNIASILTLIIVIAVIILPLTIIGIILAREAVSIYDSFNNNQGQMNNVIRNINNFLRTNPYITRFNVDDQVVTEQLNNFGRSAITFIYESTKSFAQNSLKFLALFVLMLYTLFYFLRDGERILKKLMHVFPLGDRYEKMLYDKFTSTTSATIKGTLVVGSIQGFLGGILFWITGVPSPLILGIFMAVLSLIPAAGSFLVWLPAGVIMLLTGNVWQGLVILITGTVLISTIDNLLRPMLVGKDLQMHPVVILFSTLGGVALFGISGFIIGPVVAALFQSFWEIYEHYYKTELSEQG